MSAEIGQSIADAAHFLNEGNCVGIPTETVYGLAANALNPVAVSRIFKVKNRPDFDPLIVHTHSYEAALQYVKGMPEKAKILAQHCWPGPLTLVLPKKEHIPFEVTSGLDTVGIRVPKHSLTLELLQQLEFPLAAPSANPFGYVSPTSAQHVAQQLGDKIPYILDGGHCEIGLESTIVGFEEEEPVIYRLGYYSKEILEELIGPIRVQINTSSNPKAPGMLKAHYAPLKPVYQKVPAHISSNRVGYLAFSTLNDNFLPENQVVLSHNKDLFEVARNFYAGLRKLDMMDVDCIVVDEFENTGIGVAINERLSRVFSASSF